MDTPTKFRIELLVSSYKVSNKIELLIGNDEILHIFNLADDSTEYEDQFRNELGLVKESDFKEKYDLSSTVKRIREIRFALTDSLKSIASNHSYNVYQPDLLKTKYGFLHENYLSITKYERDREIKIFRINTKDLIELQVKIQKVARKIIELNVLTEISKAFLYDEYYDPRDKILVDSPADACKKVYYSLINKEDSIDEDLFLNEVLNDYSFKKYEGKSTKEALELAEKAVERWIKYQRDNKTSFKFD